jgi:hypothetical protein
MLAGLAGSYIFEVWAELLMRVVRENGSRVAGIKRSNIYNEWTVRAFPTSVAWQEYHVICVAFTFLYQNDRCSRAIC